MKNERMLRVDNLTAAGDLLDKSARFYAKHLDDLRVAWHKNGDDRKAEERFKRLALRWQREADRLIDLADDLMDLSCVLEAA